MSALQEHVALPTRSLGVEALAVVRDEERSPGGLQRLQSPRRERPADSSSSSSPIKSVRAFGALVGIEGQPRSCNALTRACARTGRGRSHRKRRLTVSDPSSSRPVSAPRPGERITRSRGPGANPFCPLSLFPRLRRQAAVSLHGSVALNHGRGSTALPPLRISKYSSGRLLPPLSPAEPRVSPALTRSPTAL